MNAFDTIIGLLPKLSPQELSQVSAVVSTLSSEREAMDDVALDLAHFAVRSVYPGFPRSMYSLGPSVLPKYKKGLRVLIEFASEHFTLNSRPIKVQTYEVLTRMLLNWMHDCTITTTPKTVAQQLSNIVSAVDTQMPGYRELGMLERILIARPKGSK